MKAKTRQTQIRETLKDKKDVLRVFKFIAKTYDNYIQYFSNSMKLQTHKVSDELVIKVEHLPT